MKNRILLGLMIVLSLQAFSQKTGDFIRPSISFVEIVANNPRINITGSYYIPESIDENNIDKKVVKTPSSYYNSIIDDGADMLKPLIDNKVTNQAVLSVLPIIDGKFSNSVIKKRGAYSATDAQVNDLIGTVNQDFANIEDNFGSIGIKQLDKIYIVVASVHNYRRDISNDGYTITVSSEVMYQLIKVNNALEAVSKYGKNPEEFNKEGWQGQIIRTKNLSVSDSYSQDELDIENKYADRVKTKIYTNILKSVTDFQPESTIIISPKKKITARIGTKEGLEIDNRFMVYEQRQDTETSEIKLKRRSTVRVKRVGVNSGLATGDSEPSIFYKIAGKRVTDGMLLIQKEDVGIGVTVGYGNAQWLRLDYRLKSVYTGFKAYVSINRIAAPDKEVNINTEALAKQLSPTADASTIDAKWKVSARVAIELGFEWAYVINSRLQFLPFIGIGYTSNKILKNKFASRTSFFGSKEYYEWKDTNPKLRDVITIHPGGRLSLNITGNVAIVGSVGYMLPINIHKQELEYKIPTSTSTKTIKDLDKFISYPSSFSGLKWNVGLRFEF